MLPWKIIRVNCWTWLKSQSRRAPLVMDGFRWICLTLSKKPDRPFMWRTHTYSALLHQTPFMFQRTQGKFWMKERRPGYSQPNTHRRSIFDWWQTRRIALSSLTFPKQRLCFSLTVTSVNFISGGDLEGLGLKSTRSFWFSPYNDFHGDQDLNGGEIMSASHYCKLYPLLRPSRNS